MASDYSDMQTPSDSPNPGESEFLVVGRLGRPHGVRGEIVLAVLTDFPERIIPGKRLFLGEGRAPYTIESRRGSDNRMILKFNGVDDRDAASHLRSQLAAVLASEVPALPDGEFYLHELVGLSVVLEDGKLLGEIAEIISTGANDVFLVRDADGLEKLLPAIDDVILDIDLAAGRVLARLIPGL